MPSSRHIRIVVAVVAYVAALSARGQGLPPVPTPLENPTTPQKVILGKILFFDEQMSGDDTLACATCHLPDAGGGDPHTASPGNVHPGPDGVFGGADDIQSSRSVVRCASDGNFFDDGTFFPGPIVLRRKASPAIGAQWDPESFWDGAANGTFIDPDTGLVAIQNFGALENQSIRPPASGSMGCQSRTIQMVAQKLATSRPLRIATNLTPDIQAALLANPTYPALFAAAFGDSAVTPVRLGFAMAAYERILIPDQTPFDAFQAGQTSALTPAQQAGWTVFNSAGCATCHSGPLFTNHSFRNIGVRPPAEDKGRQLVTGLNADRGKFKVPHLRNIGLRAPYFHNGRTATLADVVDFYDRGGDFADNRDPAMVPLGLSPQQKANLVDFLANALTDPRVVQKTAPFDRPTLNSELSPNPAGYGYGSPGSGGAVPVVVAPIPPMIGSHRFGAGVANALGGSFAVLGISSLPAPGWLLGSSPVWVDLDPSIFLPLTMPLAGNPGAPGEGFASMMFQLPDTPALANITLYAQWLVFDPGVPDQFAVSAGFAFTFFAP